MSLIKAVIQDVSWIRERLLVIQNPDMKFKRGLGKSSYLDTWNTRFTICHLEEQRLGRCMMTLESDEKLNTNFRRKIDKKHVDA